jgi:type II secretory pathway pseudopilin PulG
VNHAPWAPRIRRTDMRGNPPTKRAAYTLVEVTVSLGLMTLIMTGLGTVVLLASHALPDEDAPAEATIRAHDVLDQLASDLQCAQGFIDLASNKIEFLVPDRDGDDAPETIAYKWAGGAGDPLLKTYNGSTAFAVAESLDDFRLAYEVLEQIETVMEDTVVESEERVLASFTGWPGISADYYTYTVSPTAWMCAVFQVPWPADTEVVAVRFTRAMATVRQDDAGPDTRLWMGIVEVGGSMSNPLPTTSMYGTGATTTVGDLSASYAWTQFTFGDAYLEDPDEGDLYGMLLIGEAAETADVQYAYAYAAGNNGVCLRASNNSGSTWQPAPSYVHRYETPFYVYGTITTSGMQEVEKARTFMNYVEITLQPTAESTSALTTTVETLNRPEVVLP